MEWSWVAVFNQKVRFRLLLLVFLSVLVYFGFFSSSYSPVVFLGCWIKVFHRCFVVVLTEKSKK